MPPKPPLESTATTSPECGVGFDVGDDGFHVGQVETVAAEAGDVGGEFGGIEAVVFRDLVEIR